MIRVTLLQSRHLRRQTVPPQSTTDGLQPVLPLTLWHDVLHLILWGHDVTSSQADVVQDGTCSYDLKLTRIIH